MLALAIGALVVPGHTSASPAYYIPSALDVPLSAHGCYGCDWCGGGRTETEQLFEEELTFGFTDGKTCGPGLCDGDLCGVTEEEDALDREEMVMVWDAVVSGNGGLLKRLVEERPDAVWYNADRRSIQFRSCATEDPVANLPLSDELMADLQ